MSKPRPLRCFDYVNHPYEQVRDALRDHAETVFQAATKVAAARAHTVASELRVNLGGIELATDIEIRVTRVEQRAAEGSRPPLLELDLEWEAARMPRLFPFMKAELTVYRLTSTETQLDLNGHYAPPLGALGNAMDAVVGHRIAEACVHRFLCDVADYLKRTLD